MNQMIIRGVKNKFCWNVNKIGTKEQGICSCKPHCVERGKKSICTQITISVFQSKALLLLVLKQFNK